MPESKDITLDVKDIEEKELFNTLEWALSNQNINL